jgi:hypothetical protein
MADEVAAEFPPTVRRFCVWVAVMTLLSEAFDWALRSLFHQRPPWGGSFVWEDTGGDFRLFAFRFLHFRTPEFWNAPGFPFSYPAPVGLAYWLLYKLPRAEQVYLALGILALAGWAWYFSGELAERGLSRTRSFALLLVFVPLCWPVRMQLQTGNIEGLAAVVLGVGIVAALRRRWGLAGALIGLAGAMKVFPFLLLGLLLSRRRYKELAFGLAVAAGVTVASLAVLGPSIVEAQRHIDAGLAYILDKSALSPVVNGLPFNHSLFSLVKDGIALDDTVRHPGEHTEALRAARVAREYLQMKSALRIYLPVVAVLGCLLYGLRLRHLPLLNQAIGLTVCAVLLPPFSFDYTLIHLLVPLGLLLVYAVDAWRDGVQPRGVAAALLCFAFLMTTGDYFRLRYMFNTQVRTLALLALLAVVCIYPFRSPTYDGADGA